MSLPSRLRLIAVVFLFLTTLATAGPNIAAGDLVLRHDIQRLADHGVIKQPITAWPIAWGPVLEDLSEVDASLLPDAILSSLIRVRDRADREAVTGELKIDYSVALSDNPTRIRSFQDTPRGKAEVSARAVWVDDWFGVELNAVAVDSDQDSDELRADGSMIGVLLGNWSVAASTQQRWWGPAWDGTLILSNNARPIPSLVIDRVFTNAFESRWLSWIGPWDLNVIVGQLERAREVPNARFFGMRINFRPLSSLEIGLSRTAQWCGDGRPCDAGTFFDLLVGNDNINEGGVTLETEPGNQLAGVDVRWAPPWFGRSTAVYGQFVGEDEAGGFPSRWLGQFGAEWSGYLFNRWSSRVFAEFAGTSCQFYESSEIFNCAYNHSIYNTGYRFRGRAIGHGADNDSRIISLGAMMIDTAETSWRALLRFGELNSDGSPDVRNSLTPIRQDVSSIDLSHSRVWRLGLIDIGVGFENVDDPVTGVSTSDERFYLQWRSSY